MKSTRESVVQALLAYAIILLVFMCIGCSSKDTGEREAEHSAQAASLQKEVAQLRNENANLKKALTETIEKTQQQEQQTDPNIYEATIRRLEQENDTLREALAKAIEIIRAQGASASGGEQMKQLKQEKDTLQKALAGAMSKIKEQIVLRATQREGGEVEVDPEAVIVELGSDISPKRKIELIDSLTELAVEQHPSVIDVVQKALDDPNPVVARDAIGLLEGYETPEILPAISQALESRDEQVRLNALALLGNVDDPEVVELLSRALNDRSENVRSAALEVAQEHTDDIQLSVLEEAISSSYNDVRTEALSLLEFRGDHNTIDIIIEGLLDTDSEFREEVNSALDFLIDREFENYEAARAWWDQNKHRYDEDLFEIDVDDDNENDR